MSLQEFNNLDKQISCDNCSKYAHYVRFAYLLFLTAVDMSDSSVCLWKYASIVKYTNSILRVPISLQLMKCIGNCNIYGSAETLCWGTFTGTSQRN